MQSLLSELWCDKLQESKKKRSNISISRSTELPEGVWYFGNTPWSLIFRITSVVPGLRLVPRASSLLKRRLHSSRWCVTFTHILPPSRSLSFAVLQFSLSGISRRFPASVREHCVHTAPDTEPQPPSPKRPSRKTYLTIPISLLLLFYLNKIWEYDIINRFYMRLCEVWACVVRAYISVHYVCKYIHVYIIIKRGDVSRAYGDGPPSVGYPRRTVGLP